MLKILGFYDAICLLYQLFFNVRSELPETGLQETLCNDTKSLILT